VTTARQLLSAVRPRDAVRKARKQLALDYLGELERLDARLKELKKSLTDVLDEHPTTLREINGVGPINATKILAETGDVRRFPSKAHFGSYTGTAPVDVSSGDNNRHRLKPRRQPPAQPRPAHRRGRAVPHAQGPARTTTGASATRARPTSKRCAASNADSPTSSTATSSTTWQQGAALQSSALT
jgi:hypothetical protein